MSYVRFLLMISVSTITMFGLMYLNTYEWDHIFFSETRSFAALFMGASMAIIMLAFMLGMYTKHRRKLTENRGTTMAATAKALIYRVVMPDHICPPNMHFT